MGSPPIGVVYDGELGIEPGPLQEQQVLFNNWAISSSLDVLKCVPRLLVLGQAGPVTL